MSKRSNLLPPIDLTEFDAKVASGEIRMHFCHICKDGGIIATDKRGVVIHCSCEAGRITFAEKLRKVDEKHND